VTRQTASGDLALRQRRRRKESADALAEGSPSRRRSSLRLRREALRRERHLPGIDGGLFFALALGIAVAYMVLASQFNSFLHPVTVLTVLPLSVTGALLASGPRVSVSTSSR